MQTSVTSEVQIMNSALIKLGAEPILSPDDNSNRARLCKRQYPLLRDALFRDHPFRFSTSYATLANVTIPDAVFGYTAAFQLPVECARIFEINMSCTNWTEIEGGLIVTNGSVEDQVRIRFGKIITDVTKYDATFVELLAWSLAKDIAYALTQSTAARDSANIEYEKQLQKARTYSAQVGTPQQVKAEGWLDARR